MSRPHIRMDQSRWGKLRGVCRTHRHQGAAHVAVFQLMQALPPTNGSWQKHTKPKPAKKAGCQPQLLQAELAALPGLLLLP